MHKLVDEPMTEKNSQKTILWWGRSDPDYSRNRILREIVTDRGWNIVDYSPAISVLGDIQVLFKGFKKPDLVWVPCFRQRDYSAARRYARKLEVPLLFDPLISAYDKQVFEKNKLHQGSGRAQRLRRWERGMFQSADIVLADTAAHALFFEEELGADPARVFVVPVGAEEELFKSQPYQQKNRPLEVLFYGSFIPLQGVDVIVEAAKLTPEINWTLLGQGKLLESCMNAASGARNIRFEGWVPYNDLPQRIGRADILLGVFGITPKAKRVIPNKVYQALACSRPVITLDSPVYSNGLREMNTGGMAWVPAGDARALSDRVRSWASTPERLTQRGNNAREIYDTCFSVRSVAASLAAAIE